MTLSISIIIPVKNEEKRLGRLLDFLGRYPGLEIIVVDGGSSDRTKQIASSRNIRVIDCPPGRGMQLKKGAENAGGTIFFFLHCDSILPKNFPELIQDTLQIPGTAAGAFSLGINNIKNVFRLIEQGVKLRSSLLQMPFGDQGLFLYKETYLRSGGFSDQPLFEDVDLVRQLKKMGKIRIVSEKIMTSARRWNQNGIVRTTVSNLFFMLMYWIGISPSTLADWYYRK